MNIMAAAPSSLVESLFQRSLDDLIKALRSHPSGESALLSRSLDEIRREIRSVDPDTKSVALQKLTYISTLHFLDMSWASFHALELLPSPNPNHKRIAYLAASLSFHPSTTEVLPLATHQLRKDLSPNSPDPHASLALHLLSLCSSPDLSAHLTAEIHSLLASPRPAIRRKATAAALRVLNLCPDSVRVSFPRLVENLSSQDPRAVSAAVGVFCELSASDPRSYLPLAPDFYRLLLDSKNNWVLIKILKIFARLATLEPRLAKRVVDPICDLLRGSAAKSLVFECIRTVLSSLSDYDHAVRLAVDKAREFLASEDDPNLRYLGLHALSMLGPRHSWAVEESRDAVIKSLTDPDPNICREALHLIMGMVFQTNVVEISVLLVNYALSSHPDFCNEILEAILSTCGRSVYEMIIDFDWYVSLLGDMARNPNCSKGDEIERQLVDIGLRVKDARPELVRVARDLLVDPALLGNLFLARILSAAAWVSGEYVDLSRNPVELVEALLQPRTILLPPLVRAVYIQAVFKVIVYCLSSYIEQPEIVDGQFSSPGDISQESNTVANCGTVESETGIANSQMPTSLFDVSGKKRAVTHQSIVYMVNLIETAVAPLSECEEVEVQERARNVLYLTQMLQEVKRWGHEEEDFSKHDRIVETVKLLKVPFSGELGPVSVHAQQRVSVPEGLVLNENLADLANLLGKDDFAPTFSASFSLRNHYHKEIEKESESPVEATSLLVEHRKRHGLYYLPTEKNEDVLNNYPRANDHQLSVSHVDAAEGNVMLTEQLLIPRKAKATKPRPVVVKLDDGDFLLTASKPVKELKDDSISNAIQDILLKNEGKQALTQETLAEKSSQRTMKDAPTNAEPIPHSKENLILDTSEHGGSSSRSRRHIHGKETHKSPWKNEDKVKIGETNPKRNSRIHHHGRRKQRQKNVPLNMVPQEPMIPDFLL